MYTSFPSISLRSLDRTLTEGASDPLESYETWGTYAGVVVLDSFQRKAAGPYVSLGDAHKKFTCDESQTEICEGWLFVSVARLMHHGIFYTSDFEALECRMANNVMPFLEEDHDGPSVTPFPRHHVRCHP